MFNGLLYVNIGRYEEHFIERRRLQLQSFVQRVCDHPILSRSDVWMHFLTCTDAKRWKTGKRKAEKDELIGASICSVINVPDKALDPLQLYIIFYLNFSDGQSRSRCFR